MSSASSRGSALSKMFQSPLALAAGVGAGVAATLALTHLVGSWCPVAGDTRRGKCPYSAGRCTKSAKKKPVVVAVTGAAGQIGYAIVFQIAAGKMLGDDQPIELRLLEVPTEGPQNALAGTVMELEDCAFPLLSKIVPTSDPRVAFEGCEIALLIGARPRGPGMTRADLLKGNAHIFKEQGRALDQFASRNVKVLVVGNPANTNCKIAMEHAPSLPKTAWSAMTRLDELRATAQVAKKAGVSVGQVKNVIVWGNHSDTQLPDLTFATVHKPEGTQTALEAIDNNKGWAEGDFIDTVQRRGTAVIDKRKASSAASAANAAVQHVRSWFLGTAPGEWVSMAVASRGEYGVPRDLIFSFPCTCKDGQYTVVPGLESKISEFAQKKMKVSWEQLVDEDKQWREQPAQ